MSDVPQFAEKDALYALWREAAAKGITEGVDWPRIALHLFRDLDDALAFKNAVLADRARETARTRVIPPVEGCAPTGCSCSCHGLMGGSHVVPCCDRSGQPHCPIPPEADLCHEFIETGDCDHTDAEHDAMQTRVLPPEALCASCGKSARAEGSVMCTRCRYSL